LQGDVIYVMKNHSELPLLLLKEKEVVDFFSSSFKSRRLAICSLCVNQDEASAYELRP
jgi:hypothetical protein